MKSLAAILTAVNQPLEIHPIEWQPLQYGQVLVKIEVSGICGAQLQEWRGEKGDIFPRLLGHEASGEVVEVGPGVKTVKVGDRVVCHWRKGNGIESDSPKFSLAGTTYTAGQITTFSQCSVISENRLTAVPSNTPVELCALLGCGLSTALGTIEREAKLGFGESLLVIGCGGLGMNLITAAVLRGAGSIGVIEVNTDKMAAAQKLGATHFGQPEDDWGMKFDVIIDTTGNERMLEKAFINLAPSGRLVMVGQPKPRQNVMLTNARSMFDGEGKTILATQGGGFQPSQDIPRYTSIRELDIHNIVTHRFPLERINEAMELVRQGQAGRVLIEM